MSAVIVNSKIGDCEACSATNTKITLRHGNIWMCDSCWEKEPKLNTIIEQSRAIDASIEIKQDLFNAATIPAIELKAAILQDESIPVSDKDYRFTSECYDRFMHLKAVIFEDEKVLNEKKNQLRMWQVQVQSSAATLRTEQREKFKQLDINYTPTSPKSPKPAAVKVPGAKSAKQADIHAACIKANIVELEPTVTMLLKMRVGMTIEAAVAHVSKTITQ